MMHTCEYFKLINNFFCVIKVITVQNQTFYVYLYYYCFFVFFIHYHYCCKICCFYIYMSFANTSPFSTFNNLKSFLILSNYVIYFGRPFGCCVSDFHLVKQYFRPLFMFSYVLIHLYLVFYGITIIFISLY